MKIPVLALLSVCLFLGAGCEADGSAGSQKTVIAVIPKGTTHVFWKSIHSGAKEAADELGVVILWKGQMREDERGSQIKLVEHRVTARVDGIVLAPLDDKALVRPVHEALDKNIPVIIIDSALDSDRTASFVATDNFKGGQMAAQELGRLLGGKGTALMLRYQEGSASTEKRERGFLDVMEREFPEIQMVSTNQYAGATQEGATTKGENLLTRYPKIGGIFCPNESAVAGMLVALQGHPRAGEIKFIGFDSSDALVGGLKKGIIHGLIVQDPRKMGYLGVKMMVQLIRGERIEKRVDTGVYLATLANMNTPEMRKLVEPDLSNLR
jgi:ribose transport system substrate-binding protein